MANTILHKRNSTPGTVPTSGALSQGELGINIGDGKLYTKNSSNTVINLGVTSISGTYITPSSGNFNYLAVSGVPVSVSGHSHLIVPQAQSLVTTVFNKTASTIPKFSIVYINGGQGDQPTIQLAIANGESGSSNTYAITSEAISSMSAGSVIVAGALSGINTDQFNPTAPAGDVNGVTLYLSPSVSGAATTTKPYAPNHLVSIGNIVRTHQNEGIVEVKIQNGFELQELHNVAVTGATNGQFLQYNSGSGLWVPSSSGNFSSLSVNNTGVSLSGHNHNGVYADIATGDPTLPGNSIVDRAYALYDLPNDYAALWINDSTVYAADNAIFDSFKINMGLDSAVTGIGIINHIPYWNSINGMVADSGQLVWDSTNNRLGIGTAAPSGALDVGGTSYFGSTGVANNLYLRTGQAGISETALKLRTDTSSNLYLDASSAYVKVGNQSADVDIRAGNSNVTIGNSSAGTLANQFIRFMPANTERMRLDGNGNLGIGTTSPSSILHISQNDAILRIADASSNTSTGPRLELNSNYGGSLYSAYLGFSYYNNKTYLQHGRASIGGIELRRANGTAALYVQDSNGYIGIGTTTPSGQLHVAGDVLATGSFIAGSGNAANPSFEFVGDTDTGMFAPEANAIGLATSGVERLRINNLGNIGIGITAPTTKLDVRGSFSCGTAGGDPSAGAQGLFIDPSIPSLSFNDNVGPSLALTIDDNGLTLFDFAASPFFYTDRTNSRIGIGTNSPNANFAISAGGAGGTIDGAAQSQPFQINDATASDYINLAHFNITNSSSRGSFTLSNNSSSAWENNVMQFFVHGSTYAHAYYGGNTSDAGCAMIVTQGSEITKLQIGNYGSAPIEFFTGNTFRAIIDTAGNVGIGTTSPSEKLDVNGNVNIDGNLTFDSFTESVVAIGNSSTSQTIDLTSGTVQTCTLTGNCTFTMPTATAGKSFSLFLNTGSGGFTATFTGVRWSDSTPPTITSTASKVDLLSFISDGTYWYGSFSQNYG